MARFTGLLAALLITISRFDIGWAQEMRMYALAALLGALALWSAVGVWQVGRRRDWLLYVLFMVLGLYNLYLAVMVLVTANLVWLCLVWPRAADRWRNFWHWSLAQMAVLLLYAPWLAYALGPHPHLVTGQPGGAVELPQKFTGTVLTVGIPLDVDQYAPLTVPVLLVFLLGVGLIGWRARKRPLDQQKLGAAAGRAAAARAGGLHRLAAQSLLFLLAAPGTALPHHLLAAFAVLLGWGIDGLSSGRSRPLGFLAAGLTVYAALFGLNSYHNNRVLFDDFPSLTATIEAYQQPDDAVVLYTDTDWPIFAYHYADFWHGIPGAWQMTPPQANDFLDPIWQQHDGIWLVRTQYAAIGDPEQHVVNWLRERAVGEVSYPYGDKQLLFFARTPNRAAAIETLIETEPPFGLDTPALSADAASDAEAAVPSLTGYDLQTHTFHSGETMHLFLTGGRQYGRTGGYWRTACQRRCAVFAGHRGFPGHGRTGPPAGGFRPFSADLSSGPYQFYVATAEGTAVFGHLTIRQKEANFLTPADVTIQNRVEAQFGEGIRLLGYDLGETTFSPGEAIPLTLYWQGAGQIGQRFKVFTHVLGEVYNINSNNFLWGQQDNEPENGRRPTTTWRTDEIIRDAYAIPLDPLAPPGVYQIEIGLYDPITGARLLLDDGSDHRILTTIRVE